MLYYYIILFTYLLYYIIYLFIILYYLLIYYRSQSDNSVKSHKTKDWYKIVICITWRMHELYKNYYKMSLKIISCDRRFHRDKS